MVARKNYKSGAVEAAHRALVEIMRALGEYQESIVLIGGWVPRFLMVKPKSEHIGSMDVDLVIDHRKIDGSHYASILEILSDRGFKQLEQPYQFEKTIEVSSVPYNVRLDLLAGEYEGTSLNRRTQRAQDLKLRKARGADLVFTHYVETWIEGYLPDGSIDQVNVRVASISAFLAMKGMALHDRMKEKDAWDIYYCICEYPGGVVQLSKELNQAGKNSSLIREGIRKIRDKFQTINHSGPRHVAIFEGLDEQEQSEEFQLVTRDAFERVNELVNRISFDL